MAFVVDPRFHPDGVNDQPDGDGSLLRNIAAKTPGVDYHPPTGQLGSYGRGPLGEPTFEPFHHTYVDWLVKRAQEEHGGERPRSLAAAYRPMSSALQPVSRTDPGGQSSDGSFQLAQFPVSADDARKYFPHNHLKQPVVRPEPPNPVTGEWSPAFAGSSPGQAATASEGEHSIQSAYASEKGGTYTVDPMVMKMEHAIDIGDQIQSSIDKHKSMYSVLTKALADPKGRINFVWPGKAFDDGPLTPAGRSVGRFKGDVEGTLTVDRKNRTWQVEGKIKIISDKYNWHLDGSSLVGNALIGIGAATPDLRDHTLNFQGKTIKLNYNRDYHFKTRGRF